MFEALIALFTRGVAALESIAASLQGAKAVEVLPTAAAPAVKPPTPPAPVDDGLGLGPVPAAPAAPPTKDQFLAACRSTAAAKGREFVHGVMVKFKVDSIQEVKEADYQKFLDALAAPAA